MKKRVFIFLLAVTSIFFSTSLLNATASAAENSVAFQDYFDIVSEKSEQYGINISFRPDNIITMSPVEFEALIDTYARRTLISNQNALAIMEKDKNTKNFSPNLWANTVSRALPTGSERVSGTKDGYRVSALANYGYNTTNEKYFYLSGESVQVEPATIFNTCYFIISSSSCSVLDTGRTLAVTATGTSNIYLQGSGWIAFPNTTLRVEIYYTALSVN